MYISEFILRNASRLFSLVLLELQVDNCIHLHRELLSSAPRYASYRWFNSSTRVSCKAGPKCPAIPWYQQESIQISTDHYMQQRQKGYHYRKLTQVNLKVAFTFPDTLAATTLHSLSTCHWNRGIAVPATIKILRRKSGLVIYCIRLLEHVAFFWRNVSIHSDYSLLESIGLIYY